MAAEVTITISAVIKDAVKKINELNSVIVSAEKEIQSVTKASGAAFVGFAGAIGVATNSFAKFETALVGVQKTTDLSNKQTQEFGKSILALSNDIPVAATELLNIAQAAGQLGVKGQKNLQIFTETIAKLGFATDLAGEEAALALTRILNVTNEGIDTIDKFGSVIVALGNNFAATESEIVRVSTEVARSTSVFKLSSAQVAAISATLKSLGIQAQIGGTAVGKAFRAIDKSIRDGGQALSDLSELTGMTGEQLKQTFKEDSTAVFQSFIEGLGRVQEAGGDVTGQLEQFGLQGEFVAKVLPVVAQRSDLLGKALKVAGAEAKNATALNEEAAKAFDTLSAQTIKTRNSLGALVTRIGAELAPVILKILEKIQEWAITLQNLDESTVKSIASFLKWGAIITGAVTAIGTFLVAAIKVSAVIGGLAQAFGIGAIAAGGFWAAITGPVGIAVAGFVGLAAVAAKFFNILDRTENESIDNLTAQLEKLRKKREELANDKFAKIDLGRKAQTDAEIREIDREIAKLEELKKKKGESSPGGGGGDTGDGGVAAAQEIANKKKQIRDQELADEQAAADLRKQIKEAESQALLSVQENQSQELQAQRQEELQLLRDLEQAKTDIEKEFAQARLDNFRAESEEKRALLEAQAQEQMAQKRLQAEEERLLDEELSQLKKDDQDLAREEDLTRLSNDELLKRQILIDNAKTERDRKQAERKQFIKDEIAFGKTAAKIKKVLNSSEVQAAEKVSGELVQLTQSRNNTLKSIGKAAAITQILIGSSKSAMNIFEGFTSTVPPPAGPALGAVGAAAAIAFGAEKVSQVRSAQTGGVVPGTGSGDKIPMMLEPGEVVIPKPLAPTFSEQFSVNKDQDSDIIPEAASPIQAENIIGTQEFVEEFVNPAIRDSLITNNGDIGI